MEETSASTSKASIETASIHDLASLTAEMLNSGRYSDLTIKCHSKIFNVHRNVVCLQSRPLAAAVDGGFMEGITGVIDLEDDDADIIEKLVHYFYHQDYFDGRPSVLLAAEANGVNVDNANWGTTGAVLLNTKVYIAADKYDIPALKALSKAKYQSAVSEEWNDDRFATSLKLLYENTMEDDRTLKDIAVEVAAKNISQLLDRGEFVELFKANGEIAFDVLQASKASKARFKACSSCHSSTYVTNSPRNKGYLHCVSCESRFKA